MMTRDSTARPGSELPFLTHVPEGVRDGSALLVLLHGRGSNEGDLQGLAPLLPKDTILVTPRAPFAAGPWGYGPGWAWYRYIAEDRVDDPTLAGSLDALDGFLESIADSLPVRPGPLVLGGFSQGGTTSLAFALTRPGSVAGVANLSGFLVQSPMVAVEERGAKGLEVFWAHGRIDPNIPFALGVSGRERLRAAGATVEAFDHPSGHTITAEEVTAFRSWIEGLTRS
jgi:phospholipase/carboxylesterase